jgi:hypothetical protein
MQVHRLVGWWLGIALPLLFVCVPAHAQSTAAFPSDTPPPPPPRAQPKPVAPAPRPVAPASKPVAPASKPAHSAPVATPTPHPAPPPSQPPPAVVVTPPPPAHFTPGAPAADVRPPVLPYYQGMPVPPGYKVVTRPATGVITGGAVGLAASYATAVIFGAAQGFDNASGWLAAPIIGPWLAITERNYGQCKTANVQEARQCVTQAVHEVQYITFVAVDGVFQMATGFLLLAGALSAKDELLRQDLVPKVSFVVPTEGHHEWALRVQGRF